MSTLQELAVRLYDAGAVRLGDIETMEGRRTPVYFDLRVVVSHPKLMMSTLQELAVRLYDAGAVRLGDIEAMEGRRTPVYFDLRVVVSHPKLMGAFRLGDIEAIEGRRTPVYFDLRVVVSHPKLMLAVVKHLQNLASEITHDIMCGVPYAALPFTAVMSVSANTPMIMKRKETKQYGTKKILEGVFQKNQRCLVIEDVVTSGGSLLETIESLRAENLLVTHAVIVLDREQGGVSVLKANGVEIRALFTMTNLVKILRNAGRITDDTVDIISDHIKGCQFGLVNVVE